MRLWEYDNMRKLEYDNTKIREYWITRILKCWNRRIPECENVRMREYKSLVSYNACYTWTLWILKLYFIKNNVYFVYLILISVSVHRITLFVWYNYNNECCYIQMNISQSVDFGYDLTSRDFYD